MAEKTHAYCKERWVPTVQERGMSSNGKPKILKEVEGTVETEGCIRRRGQNVGAPRPARMSQLLLGAALALLRPARGLLFRGSGGAAGLRLGWEGQFGPEGSRQSGEPGLTRVTCTRQGGRGAASILWAGSVFSPTTKAPTLFVGIAYFFDLPLGPPCWVPGQPGLSRE